MKVWDTKGEQPRANTATGTQHAKLTVALTVPEVCALLRTTRLTVYNLIESGALPAYKVGPYWRIDPEDLARYKERGKARDRVTRRRVQPPASLAGAEGSEEC